MRRHLLAARSTSRGLRLAILCAVMFAAGAMLVMTGSKAAMPSSGTLTTANTAGNPLTYMSGPFTVSNPTDQVDGVPTCDGTLPCDDYTLTVNVPARGRNDLLRLCQ